MNDMKSLNEVEQEIQELEAKLADIEATLATIHEKESELRTHLLHLYVQRERLINLEPSEND